MTVFDTMIDDLFADANIAVDVLYTPAGGPQRSVRATQSAPEEAVGDWQTKAKGSPLRLDMRISEVPELASGDAISIAEGTVAGSYEVASTAADDSRLTWHLTLRVAP